MADERHDPGIAGVDEGDAARPLVVSLCGTYLKREMQSLHRQIAHLRAFRTVVFAEQVENLEMFPFEPVVAMEKRKEPRYRGNFVKRFWYKHVVKQWPPPVPIGHVGNAGQYYHPYDLVDLLTEWKPALVHVYYGHKAVKYRRMLEAAGVPWLVSFHGVDVVKFVDRPGYLDDLKRVFAEARLVLARSESLLDRLRELGCPEEKLRLNRTPAPLDDIDFAERQPPENGEWRLLQACRLIPKKGLFTTLKALPRVVERWPKLKFVLAGTGPDEERFRDEARAASLQNHVELLGWVGQERLRAEFSRAHAFLHPSELTDTSDQEGVPNAMVEAMAAGLPIVATTHGGIPEAVESGVDGYLVPEKDPAALADALLRLLDDPETLARFSRQANASVREKFGFERQIEALESCYAEAIALADEAPIGTITKP
ncbi:MAG: glycosyltransferase [Verrucomicrobiae bacterium]|nr:glycosyltransferase [Verrucomicrobiae bacterium]